MADSSKWFETILGSKQFNVPITTLRDRVLSKIDAEWISSGRSPLLSLDDEAKIVNHLKIVATYDRVVSL
jgi:DNA polymerase/3'-5' exonuclease PolX